MKREDLTDLMVCKACDKTPEEGNAAIYMMRLYNAPYKVVLGAMWRTQGRGLIDIDHVTGNIERAKLTSKGKLFMEDEKAQRTQEELKISPERCGFLVRLKYTDTIEGERRIGVFVSTKEKPKFYWVLSVNAFRHINEIDFQAAAEFYLTTGEFYLTNPEETGIVDSGPYITVGMTECNKTVVDFYPHKSFPEGTINLSDLIHGKE